MDNANEHLDYNDADNGSDGWQEQYEHFLEQVSEHGGRDIEDLRDDDDFNADYEAAFGLEQGENHLHGFTWDDSREYAEFLADWLDYTPDEIDYWLGYE